MAGMVNAMSRSRLENLNPERQRHLFDIAAQEFAEVGYDGASLNRIIKQSGMSKSSLYYYFDSKADLFTTTIERSATALLREIGEFDVTKLTAETFWSEIEALFRRAVVILNGQPWYVRLGRLFYRLRGNPKQGAPTSKIFNAARLWTAGLVAKGQALGVVRSDLPVSLVIEALMGLGEAADRWVVENWSELSAEERLDIVGSLMEMFRRLAQPDLGSTSLQRAVERRGGDPG